MSEIKWIFSGYIDVSTINKRNFQYLPREMITSTSDTYITVKLLLSVIRLANCRCHFVLFVLLFCLYIQYYSMFAVLNMPSNIDCYSETDIPQNGIVHKTEQQIAVTVDGTQRGKKQEFSQPFDPIRDWQRLVLVVVVFCLIAMKYLRL